MLEEAWELIRQDIRMLRRYYVLDDFSEINEITEICEALIAEDIPAHEPWNVREHIAHDILENGFFNKYGVQEPMQNLLNSIILTDREWIQIADWAAESGWEFLRKYAAALYKDNGYPEKYYQYLEDHLTPYDITPYLELLAYYRDKDPKSGAKIAWTGLERYQEDQTEFVIYLMQEAMKQRDEETVKELTKISRLRPTIQYPAVAKRCGLNNSN